MPISAKSIKALAKKIGVDETKLKSAMDAPDEQDIEIPDVIVFPADKKPLVFTQDELNTRDTAKAKEGATTALEMQIKEYKKENGLDFKGKDLKSLAEHLSAKNDSDEVVKKLRENLTTAEQERDNAKAEAGKIMRKSKLESVVAPTNNGLSAAKVIALMEVDGYEFKEENGAIHPYLNGQRVKDGKLQTDLAYDAVIKSYQEENKLVGDPDAKNGGKTGGGGLGSKTTPKPTFTKASEVQKAFEEKHGVGSSMGTEHDYAGHLNKAMKEAEEAGTPLVMD